MTRKHPSFRVKLLRQLRPWHRRLGIVSVIFIMFMALSGVGINHSNDLSLDNSHVNQQWLLDTYGIAPPTNIAIFQTQPKLLAVTDNRVWFDGTLLLEANDPIRGVVYYRNMLVIADSHHLYLASPNGDLLETQSAATGLPTNITGIAIGPKQQIWLNTPRGSYLADDDLIEWQLTTHLTPIQWVKPIDNANVEAVSLQARSIHLTWERVLLDLHSGRFFGTGGTLFMDLVALLLLLISLSGLYIWIKQRPSKRPHKKT